MNRAIARSFSDRRWAGGVPLRSWSGRRYSWRAMRHASSPAPCCPWTAAIPRCEEPTMSAPFDPATARLPYAKPQPAEMARDLVVAPVLPADDRIWVPQAPNVWFRPLCLSASQGYWVNLLKVTRAGVLSRHRHTNPVHGYVLKGRWHYLEHDWVAEQGGYVYEPPGEAHTLVVPEDDEGVISL